MASQNDDKSSLIEDILFYIDSTERELIRLGIRRPKNNIRKSFERTKITLGRMEVETLSRIHVSAKVYLEMLTAYSDPNFDFLERAAPTDLE